MSDNRDIGYAVFAFGFGIWSFFWGFNRLRRKRLMENIPTSTVRGLAMGLVELTGKAERTQVLKGPLTGVDCVAYLYKVERYEKRGKSGSWVTIAKGDSFFCPFWLNDGTGKVLVSPKGAELILDVDYEFKTGWGKPIPDNLLVFLEANHLKYKSIFGNYPLRFREWDILPGQTVYVLGTAAKNHDFMDNHNSKLIKRLEELKNDREKMSQIDLNKDGNISQQEWDAATAKVERELLEEELRLNQSNECDIIITAGEQNNVFIISDKSQKELAEKFTYQILLGVFGGAVLTLLMLCYLLKRLRIL